MDFPPQEKVALAVRLLTIDLKQNKRISALEKAGGGLELDKLRTDLLGVVLDFLGVPPDNTVELSEKYGHKDAYDHPGMFCRDEYGNRWDDVKKENQITGFVKWVLQDVADRERRKKLN